MNNGKIGLQFFLFCFIICWAFKGLEAQEPYYYSFGEDAGFPVQQIYEIYQDRKGHLWIGCNGGLFEYDGTQFIQYQTPGQNSGSISNINEDSQGRIWSRNFRGQVFHTQENNRLVQYLNWEDSIQQFPNIFIDRDDQLYLTSRKGVYRQKIDTKEWTFLLPKDTSYLKEIPFNTASFFLNQKGETDVVTVSTFAGTIRGDNISFFENKSVNRKPDRLLRTFFFNNRQFIIDSQNAIFELIDDTYSFVTDLTEWGLSKHSVLWVTDLKDNKIAFGTRDGLFLFNYQFKPINKKPYFKNKKVSCVLKDREGNIWVTTLQDGLFMIPNIEVMLFNTQNTGIPENSIYSIEALPSGDLLLGFAGGIMGKLSSDGSFSELFKPAIRSEISDIVYNSANKSTYFINWSKLLIMKEKGSVSEIAVQVSAPKELKFYGNNLLVPTNVGIIWFKPQQKGDSYFNKLQILTDHDQIINDAIFPVQNKYDASQALFIRSVKKANSVELDTIHNRLWGIFSDGVFWFKDQQIERLIIDSVPVTGNKIVSTTDSMLWMATSKGIMAFHDTSLLLTIPTPNSVLDVLVTDSLVWYATIKGVFKYNKLSRVISKIDKFDGIASLEIHDIKLFNSTIYLATPKGLVSFPAFKSYQNNVPPTIELSQVSILDKDTFLLPAYDLFHYQNIITIDFNAISYKSKGAHQFQYRLVGLNDTWITVPGQQNTVRFISVPHGNYTFEVKALNEDGIESTESKTIRFVIKPPFWKTIWFIGLMILAGGAILVTYFKIRIRNLTKQNRLEKLLKASEITAIKAQMNPHFIFNALNSIQDLILQNNLRASNLYLGRFSELLRQVLEMSGKETVSLQEEIRILEVYLELEKLRFSDNFNYQMQVDDLPADRSHISIPSMIIQPYIENAVKHGLLHKNGNKRLTVRFTADNTHIICVIFDNGVGREKAEEIKNRRSQFHKSFASTATKKRIDLLNQLNHSQIELVIEDLYEENTAVGTKVEIKFPIQFIQ